MNPYCQYCLEHPEDYLNNHYHGTLYGFTVPTDDELLERLVLEINQAGLSWNTILKKADGFHEAFDGFSVAKVAAYSEADIDRLMTNPNIIRNRKKIEAAIRNAQVIHALHGFGSSFKGWLDSRLCLPVDEWVSEFKNTFSFTGPEIVKEFLLSTGYLEGAHSPDCVIYQLALKSSPPWTQLKQPYK